MKNKFLFIILLGMFLISLSCVNAESCQDYTWKCIKQGETISLSTICPISFGCNSTTITRIAYPNSSSAITNVQATHDGAQWNYTFSDTETTGLYTVYGYSTNFTINESFVGDFLVTHSGNQQTTAQGIGSLSFILIMFFMCSLLMIVGFKLSDSEYLWIVGIFLMFFSLLIMVYISWLGYEYQLDYAGSSNSIGVPEILFYIFLAVIGMGLIVSVILLFKKLPLLVEWFKGNILKKSEDGWDDDKF